MLPFIWSIFPTAAIKLDCQGSRDFLRDMSRPRNTSHCLKCRHKKEPLFRYFILYGIGCQFTWEEKLETIATSSNYFCLKRLPKLSGVRGTFLWVMPTIRLPLAKDRKGKSGTLEAKLLASLSATSKSQGDLHPCQCLPASVHHR